MVLRPNINVTKEMVKRYRTPPGLTKPMLTAFNSSFKKMEETRAAIRRPLIPYWIIRELRIGCTNHGRYQLHQSVPARNRTGRQTASPEAEPFSAIRRPRALISRTNLWRPLGQINEEANQVAEASSSNYENVQQAMDQAKNAFSDTMQGPSNDAASYDESNE